MVQKIGNAVHKLHVFKAHLGQLKISLETLLSNKNMLKDIRSSSTSNLGSLSLKEASQNETTLSSWLPPRMYACVYVSRVRT